MAAFFSGARLAFRRLAEQPGLTTLAIIVIALGIGLTTAVFSVLNGLVLRPLPYRDPERLLAIQEFHRTQGYSGSSYGNFVDWSRDVAGFSSTALLAVSDSARLAQLDGREPPGGLQEVSIGRVTASFFPMLGVDPTLGRWLSADEGVTGRDDAIVLADQAWRRWFGSRRDVLGRTLVLDGRRRTVVGVMPRGFHFNYGSVVAAFVPFTPATQARDARMHATFARLAQGVSVGQAREQLRMVASRLAREYPATNGNWTLEIAPLLHASDMADASVARSTHLGFAAALLVMAVCGANVASLLLARAQSRSRELAIRAALGASRAQAVRLVIAESMVLSLLGTGAGLIVASAIRSAVARLVPAYLDFPSLLTIDVRSVGFALVLGLALGLACGVLPAMRTTAVSPSEVLKDEAPSAGGSRSRVLAVLVSAQVAVAVALLVGCGLLAHSLTHLHTTPLGYRTSDLLTMRLVLPEQRDLSAVSALQDALVAGVEGLPGVTGAAAGGSLPLSGDYNGLPVLRDGREEPADPRLIRALVHAVTPAYFDTLGITLRRGRVFDRHDAAQSEPVAVVSASLARREWADEDPLGRQLRVDGSRRTVVGIVSDVRHRGPLTERIDDDVYLAQAQTPSRRVFLAVRGREAARLAPAVRRLVRDLDPEIVVSQVRTMEEALAESTAESRARTEWAFGFAAVALLLAGTGLFSSTAYWAAQRSRELAVRQALGADPRRIVGLVLGRALRIAGAGVLSGLAVAAASSRALAALLYGVEPLDPVSYALAALAVLLTALFIAGVPALRAARVEPSAALRRC